MFHFNNSLLSLIGDSISKDLFVIVWSLHLLLNISSLKQ